MLEMTADAARLVCDVTNQADSSAEAGLRIVVDPVHDSLSMAIAATPAREDAVITRDGARVFLSRSAARRLHQRTLRAELSANRSLFFLDG
jgi:Fe-S cluster assembly iron-binding protein IscA